MYKLVYCGLIFHTYCSIHLQLEKNSNELAKIVWLFFLILEHLENEEFLVCTYTYYTLNNFTPFSLFADHSYTSTLWLF